jgi:hypothetical protein
MVAKTVIIANPTGAVVTVNAKTAAARTVTKVVLDDATIADWPGWVAAGCAIGPYSNGTFRQRQQAGYLLARLQGLLP